MSAGDQGAAALAWVYEPDSMAAFTQDHVDEATLALYSMLGAGTTLVLGAQEVQDLLVGCGMPDGMAAAAAARSVIATLDPQKRGGLPFARARFALASGLLQAALAGALAGNAAAGEVLLDWTLSNPAFPEDAIGMSVTKHDRLAELFLAFRPADGKSIDREQFVLMGHKLSLFFDQNEEWAATDAEMEMQVMGRLFDKIDFRGYGAIEFRGFAEAFADLYSDAGQLQPPGGLETNEADDELAVLRDYTEDLASEVGEEFVEVEVPSPRPPPPAAADAADVSAVTATMADSTFRGPVAAMGAAFDGWTSPRGSGPPAAETAQKLVAAEAEVLAIKAEMAVLAASLDNAKSMLQARGDAVAALTEETDSLGRQLQASADEIETLQQLEPLLEAERATAAQHQESTKRLSGIEAEHSNVIERSAQLAAELAEAEARNQKIVRLHSEAFEKHEATASAASHASKGLVQEVAKLSAANARLEKALKTARDEAAKSLVSAKTKAAKQKAAAEQHRRVAQESAATVRSKADELVLAEADIVEHRRARQEATDVLAEMDEQKYQLEQMCITSAEGQARAESELGRLREEFDEFHGHANEHEALQSAQLVEAIRQIWLFQAVIIALVGIIYYLVSECGQLRYTL